MRLLRNRLNELAGGNYPFPRQEESKEDESEGKHAGEFDAPYPHPYLFNEWQAESNQQGDAEAEAELNAEGDAEAEMDRRAEEDARADAEAEAEDSWMEPPQPMSAPAPSGAPFSATEGFSVPESIPTGRRRRRLGAIGGRDEDGEDEGDGGGGGGGGE